MREWWPLLQIGVPIALFFVGLFAGTWVERRHYRSIEAREAQNRHIPLATSRTPGPGGIASSSLAVGATVVSLDYFKRIVAGLRNLVGGRVGAYETLVDRARREALLRMIESAPGCDAIFNVRIETSTLGNSDDRRSIGSVEALAYGTAITYRR